MIKKRLIAVVLVRHGIVVQSVKFAKYLPIGRPEIAIEYLTDWGADEIILLDISASRKFCHPDFLMVSRVAKHCRVPLTIGGGIKTLADVKKLIHAGADKVAINQAALQTPRLLSEIADVFGNQCVIGAIDVVRDSEKYNTYDYIARKTRSDCALKRAQDYEKFGCGEIFINSVDRDGTKKGFDINLACQFSDVLNIPLIICGGAGEPSHFKKIINHSDVKALAAANIFHYTEHSIVKIKSFIYQSYKNIRHDTNVKYLKFSFDKKGFLKNKRLY